MREMETGTLMRVFVGERDKLEGAPLYEKILGAARDAGMVGVTILRGVESYGGSDQVHAAHILRLSDDLPMVLEIVDLPQRIEDFMPIVDALLVRAGSGGLITLEKVRMLQYPPA